MADPEAVLAWGWQVKAGFADIKKSDPELYRQIKGHIDTVVDQQDWGYLLDGPLRLKVRANKKDLLNFWLSNRLTPEQKKKCEAFTRRPSSLSLARIQNHCEGESTIYTCSHPWSSYALLMHDIDDKDGSAGDSDQVLEVVKGLFRGCFSQVSTFGRGRHAFSFVNYKGMDTGRFRALCRLIQQSVRLQLADRGLKSGYELKGLPGHRLADNTYKTCGLLAKFPRLASADQWRDYLGRPVLVVDDLVTVVKKSFPDFKGSSLSLLLPDTVMRTAIFESETRVRITVSGKKGDKEERLTEADAATRMNRTGWNLTLKLKRPATASEILAEYESQNLNTGTDDDGGRLERAEHSADWCLKHYNPKKQPSANLTVNRQLVEQFVTDQVKATVTKKNRRSYTTEELAAALNVIEMESTTIHQRPDLQFTCPNNSFTAMFKKLNLPVDDNASSQRTKLSAIKQALTEAGLAEVYNPNWRIGKGKCYTLGKNHPRYVEFKQLHQTLTSAEQPDDIFTCDQSMSPVKKIKAPLMRSEMTLDFEEEDQNKAA